MVYVSGVKVLRPEGKESIEISRKELEGLEVCKHMELHL